eukprot:CAMPEP_0183755174 /NCGR_PEP_ID=MMETSP0739-20130205/4021_1 /TAXON_ID=385413 /ORGANISM="Thalassiosira miniscula, Strain CCMP1093" /LENGTH=622 /DNA_ID=CAMNT_0025991937 /DNA_START=83 /DNA_END=1947 /DNA_ORIENTATION=-
MTSSPPNKRARTTNHNGSIIDDDDASSSSAKKDESTQDKEEKEEEATSTTVAANTNKSESGGDILDPITPDILTKSEEFVEAYRTATPYPHGMIHNFCKDGFLDEILTELKNNSKVKFKETDLFRVYQSVDLGNLQEGSELATKMPNLMKLKRAIYSPQYRNFVERITGLEEGTLTDEVDCAANCHAKGCHLLCHDDVIGTRKVSYIIYLTDPDPLWTKEDGGRLELYEAVAEEKITKDGDCTDNNDGDDNKNKNDDKQNKDDKDQTTIRYVPSALPIKTILPVFNSLAYFVVRPGVSFHSVQEVTCDRPRLSIQGWYHAKETPEQMENATLQRLKSTERGEDTEGDFEPLLGASEEVSATEGNDAASDSETPITALSEEDKSFLSKYINAAYLTTESTNEIRKRFEEESSVKLRHFLLDRWNAKIKDASAKEDERDGLGADNRKKAGASSSSSEYTVGISDCWKAVGPAHKQRFLQYEPPKEREGAAKDSGTNDDTNNDKNDQPSDPFADTEEQTTGALLRHLHRTLLPSPPFANWLALISGLGAPLGHRGRVRRFRPGHDYTVAHYGVLTRRSVLDATLCFCPGEGKQCTYDEATNELVGSDDDAVWESGDVGGFECYIA